MADTEPSEAGAGLSERVAEALRERIISGRLPAGSKLNERELSAELDVSRIPLREALPLLEAEGFIHSEARSGSFVHTFTLRDAVEVFDLRLRLEPFAAQCAALRVAGGASPEDLLASLEFARTGVPGEQASGRNSDLHEEIVRLADHDLLRRLSSLLNGRVRWLFRLTPNGTRTGCGRSTPSWCTRSRRAGRHWPRPWPVRTWNGGGTPPCRTSAGGCPASRCPGVRAKPAALPS